MLVIDSYDHIWRKFQLKHVILIHIATHQTVLSFYYYQAPPTSQKLSTPLHSLEKGTTISRLMHWQLLNVHRFMLLCYVCYSHSVHKRKLPRRYDHVVMKKLATYVITAECLSECLLFIISGELDWHDIGHVAQERTTGFPL